MKKILGFTVVIVLVLGILAITAVVMSGQANSAAAMHKLEVPQQRIDHLVSKKDPALLAALVKELMGS